MTNTKKIDRRKSYFMVLDTETANSLEQGLAYDIGFAVADRKGNIYEKRSLMIAEMFYGENDLMQSAYYAKKLPQYWEQLLNGEREMVSILTAKRIVARTMEEYGIEDVYAYNAHFDTSNLNWTIRYLTKSKYRWFFPYGTKYHCIWHMACQTILTQKSFLRFAIENELTSASGNISTSAETAYKYITKNADFEESHTGLEDVKIETKILVKCYAQHKKMDTKINRRCWTIPQQKRKALAL
jgi:hypothetical protein